MTWNDRDRLFNPLKSILCFLGIALAAALIITGLAGAIWGIMEVFRHITTWVL